MNLRMAVAAPFVKDKPAVRRSQQIGSVIEAMAFCAKLGHLHFQHGLPGRAVRVMTIETVLAHRIVFPKERTAFLCMAFVAIVVHRIFSQHRFGGTAVRIVTVRAGDLALTHRHVGRKIILCASVFVTLEAGVRSKSGVQLKFAGYLFHDRVAVAAHQTSGLVRASVPVSPVTAFVAG